MKDLFSIWLVIFMISLAGCKNNGDSLDKKKGLTLLPIKKNSIIKSNLVQNEILFRRWLKDTLLILKQDKSFKNDDNITLNSKYYSIDSDSLSIVIRTIIADTIDYKIKHPIKTWIGSTLYNLEIEKVNLPKKPYELKIDVIEMYGLSYSKNLIYDRNYEYRYIAIRPLNSKIETSYTLMKGNLKRTLKKESSSDWFLKDR